MTQSDLDELIELINKKGLTARGDYISPGSKSFGYISITLEGHGFEIVLTDVRLRSGEWHLYDTTGG